MSNKELRTRIQMKNDTAANWSTASTNGFIPLLGEPIFYKDNNGIILGHKTGDGVHTPNDLPFAAVNEAAPGLKINQSNFGLSIDFDDNVVFIFDAGTADTNISSAMVTEENEAGGTTATIS